MKVEVDNLDKIIKDTLTAIEKGKRQIFDIAEHSRFEYARLQSELAEVKREVTTLVIQVDELSIEEKKSRTRLAEVSQNLKKYTEKDIKEAYHQAQDKQLQLANLRGKENLLRYKRDNMEQSLRRLEIMLNKAENLSSHFSVITNYMSGNLEDMNRKIGEMKQVHKLGISIIKAQEEERRRVARDIHDGPAQLMANIVMRAEFCLKLMDVDHTRVREELCALQNLVRQSLQDVRKIIFDLRPMVLDDLGLVPAVKRYIEDFQSQYDLPVRLVATGNLRRFSVAVEVALFRVLQECLSNARKHARCKQIFIKMEITATKINFVIKDDGEGFNLDTYSKKECFGLLGMKERIQILNGEITINASPGKGTNINISVPIDN